MCTERRRSLLSSIAFSFFLFKFVEYLGPTENFSGLTLLQQVSRYFFCFGRGAKCCSVSSHRCLHCCTCQEKGFVCIDKVISFLIVYDQFLGDLIFLNST